jgi:hypothetical protein
MGLGSALQTALKYLLMSLGASVQEKKPPAAKPASGTKPPRST